jgi:hypothetical protein
VTGPREPTDEILPDVLAAAGCAAAYCGDPEVWPAFEAYLREHGALRAGDQVDREFMDFVSYFLMDAFRKAEVDLLERDFEKNGELGV